MATETGTQKAGWYSVHLQIVVGSPLECVSCPAMCSRLGLEIIDHIYEFPPVE